MTDFFSPWRTPPNGYARIRVRLRITVAAQDVAANETTLNWNTSLEKDRSQTGFYGYTASEWDTKIDGTTVLSGAGKKPDEPWDRWERWRLGSGRFAVTHDADGKKTSMAVSAKYDGANTAWAPGLMELSSTMSLPTIPRATIPTVSPSPAAVGSTVTIKLPRVVGSYTHDVTWACGSLSGTIGNGLATSDTWTVPSVMAEYPLRSLAPIVITAVTKSGGTTVGSKQVTLFARAPAVAPTLPTDRRDPSKQFDARVRLVEYQAGDWIATRPIPANTIQLVEPSSATATCSIDVSKLNAVDFPDYSVVDVDVYNGTNWIFTGHRFVLSRLAGDSVDPTKMVKYSGTEYVDYILGFGYTQKDYEWESTTPGEIMATLISDAQGRDWGTRLSIDFSKVETSLGEAWMNTEMEREVPKGTPISQVLNGLVGDGLAEYRTSYRDNRAWLTLLNPGTGSDFSANNSNPMVNLSLAQLDRAPRRASMEKRLTRVTVAGDKDVQATRQRAAFDANVFGQMEGWVTASGVSTSSEIRKIGDNALRDNASATNERTFEYSAQNVSTQFYPYSVFRAGDWLMIPDGDNTVKDRISQITVDKKPDGDLSLTVLTGDRILSGSTSLAKRQSAQTGGSIARGNQASPAPLDSRIPTQPVIDMVSSLGYWTTDGMAQSAVTLSWAAVTTALNGVRIQCDIYEVWWRPAGIGAEWSFRSATNDLSIVMPGWEVLKGYEFRVRGRSASGIFGQFSEDQPHTPLAPLVDLDGPVIADLYTDGVGSIYIVWAGILGITTAPLRLAYVVAEVSTDGGATYTTTGTPIAGPGCIVLNMGSVWGDYEVRIRGYDKIGNAGDASPSQSIELTDPHIDPQVPEAPTSLAGVPGASWGASGFFPEAWINLSWTGPTLDTDGGPIDIAGYDIWGKTSSETVLRWLTTTSTESVRIEVSTGEDWSFQVGATSDFGGVSVLSSPVIVSANATIASPGAPGAPVLSQYAGLLNVEWSGVGMEPEIKYAYAAISNVSGGPYVRAGMPLSGAGEIVIPGLATGDTYYGTIVVVDELGQEESSPESDGLLLDPITGVTVQTSPVANTGIKMTDSSLTAYDVSGNPTFIVDAATGSVWIAPYDAVFHFGADGTVAETGVDTTGLAISSEDSSFNSFIHPSGFQIRNDQSPLSWWEADASDSSLVNFFSPRAVFTQRMLLGDYEMRKEAKSTGSRLVIRYKGA